MVASLGLHASHLRMVQDGKSLPVAAYTTAPGAKSRGRDRLVSPAAVYERFTEGATIVLESLHRYWEALTDFCRDLELALGHRLQVNAYITPPGSQGFDVHSDTHDVFVLQLSGSKHWVVYDRTDPERLLLDEVIGPGSALYIPKGFPHAASAGERASAHLTVGVLTHESIDVVREIAKLAEDEALFQARLPQGAAADAVALRAFVSRQVEELRGWLDKVDVDDLTERVARRVMTTAQPVLRGQLDQLARLEEIGADTEVALRRGATCAVFPGATSLKVLLADRELEMPLATRDAMGLIAERERLRVSELHTVLDAESSVVLVRRLVREGLLEVVVER